MRYSVMVAIAALMATTSCSSSSTEPLDPTFTGKWRIYGGVDTYIQMRLEQRGAHLTGFYGTGFM